MPRDQWELNFHVRFNASYNGVVFYSLDSGSLFQTLILLHFAAAAKSLQLCPTLCDPIDCSPPGSHPWDSPGKHTGVGCHFLLQCMKVKSESEVAQSCLTLRNPMDCSLPGSSIHGIFQAKYWNGVPLPSPKITIHIVIICKHI